MVAGKIDALATTPDGRVALVEHKTSSRDASAGSDYRRALTLDPQVSIYFDGALSVGHDPDLCVYDVLKKPTLKPLLATPEESRKYTKDGRLYASQRADDETVDAYRQRVVDAICAEPGEHFIRAEIVRPGDERTHHHWNAWHTVRGIEDQRAAVRACGGDYRAVPQHSEACHRFGAPCQFLPVCEGTARLDDPHAYRRLPLIQPELPAEWQAPTQANPRAA
jgi:hypothetical protein